MVKPMLAGLALGLAAATLLASTAWFLWPRGADPTAESGGEVRVDGRSASITISGEADAPIVIGAMVPLDLTLGNPNEFEVSINRIAVTVMSVDAPLADTRHPCSVADFEVRELSEPVVLTLKGKTSHNLSALGVTRVQWPAVGMVSTAMNQDGCKGAVLSLAYQASGVHR